MTQQLDSLLTDPSAWPDPRPSFAEELLRALWTGHRAGAFGTYEESSEDKDARWVVLGAMGAAGAACYAIYRRHHRKGAA